MCEREGGEGRVEVGKGGEGKVMLGFFFSCLCTLN